MESKTNAAVEFWIARQPHFHTGHTDQDSAHAGTVEYVPEEFQCVRRPALSLIENEYFEKIIRTHNSETVFIAMQVIVDASLNPCDPPGDGALRSYVEERLAGVVAAPSGVLFPGPQVYWKGRRHGQRQDRLWAKA